MDLSVLGGPGSGNFGHAGRPGQIGGSAPRSSVVYHGTRKDVLASILSNGISNPSVRAGNKNPATYVWITPNRTVAEKYARESWDDGDEPILLKVTIPEERVGEIKKFGGNRWSFPTTIPPEWISVEDITDLAENEGDLVVWVVVRVRDGFEILGGPGSGNFGHAGRPGQIGGSAPTMSGAIAAIRKSGGFTVQPVTGDVPTTGYALSLHKDRERKLDRESVTVDALAQYTVDNWDLLSREGNYLGGWYNPNDNQVYLDVSTVVKSAEEANDLGLGAKQLEYYDLERGVSVPVHEPELVGASYGQGRTTYGWSRGRRTYSQRSDRDVSAYSWSRPDRRRVRTGEEDFGGEVVGLGGVGSGYHGHAGRPGQIGGSSKRVSNVIQRFKDRLKTHGGNISRASTPYETAFLLPDGTRVGHSYDIHETAAAELLEGAKDPIGEVLKSGVARISAGGGVQIHLPLTESQAQIIADDWNYYHNNTLFLDRDAIWKAFDPPINADEIRRWSQHPVQDVRALGGPGSGHFGHVGRPGQVGGSSATAGSPPATWPINDSDVRKLGRHYPQEIEDTYKEWADTLTEDEKTSIRYYTDDASDEINERLRENPTKVEGLARDIQDALENAPEPPPPQLVWRGLSRNAEETFRGLSVGDVVQLNGFQSSTINPLAMAPYDNTVLEILPKSGGYIEQLSDHPYEFEFLLPHGRQYRIRGEKMLDLQGKRQRVIQLEMVE